jgi:hypothetical protein
MPVGVEGCGRARTCRPVRAPWVSFTGRHGTPQQPCVPPPHRPSRPLSRQARTRPLPFIPQLLCSLPRQASTRWCASTTPTPTWSATRVRADAAGEGVGGRAEPRHTAARWACCQAAQRCSPVAPRSLLVARTPASHHAPVPPGDLAATIRACETVDACVKELLEVLNSLNVRRRRGEDGACARGCLPGCVWHTPPPPPPPPPSLPVHALPTLSPSSWLRPWFCLDAHS